MCIFTIWVILSYIAIELDYNENIRIYGKDTQDGIDTMLCLLPIVQILIIRKALKSNR